MQKRPLEPSRIPRKRYEKITSSSTSYITAHEQEFIELPTDSVSAFESIVTQVSKTSGFPLVIPGCFIHQIYTIISDKTIVKQELLEARRNGLLRHLFVDGCGTLLVRESDYREMIRKLIEAADLDENAKFEKKLLERFLNQVLPSCFDLGIPRSHLLELLSLSSSEQSLATSSLLRLGFVVFQTQTMAPEDPLFWFTIPNLGIFIREVKAGRKELISLIQKSWPSRQVFLSKLLQKGRLKGTTLPMEFHIKDCVGLGIIIARDSTLEGKASIFILPDKLTEVG